MKTRRYSTSSSSDDKALIMLKPKNQNSYHGLLRKSLQPCEFCDEVFKDRYTLYEHNVKHMIIPLILKSTHQCTECQRHFVSAEVLNTHMSQHHNKINPKHTINNIRDNVPDILRSIVEKQVFVQCDNDINILINSKLSQNNSNKAKNSENTHGPVNQNEMTNHGISASQNDNENECNTINAKLKVKEEPLNPPFIKESVSPPRDSEKESIRHRLLFEEDIEETILRDLSNECQVNIEMLCQDMLFDFDDAIKVSESDEAMTAEIKDERNYFSDELNNPENEMNNSENGMNHSVSELNSSVNELNSSVNELNSSVNELNSSVNEMNNSVNGINIFSSKMNYCESNTENFKCETNYPDNGINFKNDENGLKNRIIIPEDSNFSKTFSSNFDNESNNSGNEMNNFNNGIGDIQISENGIHFQILNTSEKVKIQFEKAIHCDDLMRPDISVCKFCGKKFPNRFERIQHEPIHLQIKKKHWNSPLCCFCDRYMAGNHYTLRNHIAKKHPEEENDRSIHPTHYCLKCGLKYHNYKKHLKNYHEAYKCETCSAKFETLKKKNSHACGEENTETSFDTTKNYQSEANHYTVMQLCELCIAFMRIYMQNRQNYEEIGMKTELDKTQTCDKCNKEFTSVILVKRRTLGRVGKANDRNTSDFSQKAADGDLMALHGLKASDVGENASGFSHKPSDVGRKASGFSYKASDVGNKASGFSYKASDVGKKASDVGKKASDVVNKPRMKTKPLSNKDRLMKIQNRFKMLKMINKR